MTRTARLTALVALGVVGCAGGGVASTQARRAPLESHPSDEAGRVEVRDFPEKPRLTLVTRDGDPSPALVVAVITDAGPIETTALAALVEARLQARGLAFDLRVDRSAFHLRFVLADATAAPGLFASVAAAFQRAVAPAAPELAHVLARLDELRANPLEAPELEPIAECTGQLAITSDPARRAPNATELERYRRATLSTGHTSIAVVGPAALCSSVASSFAASTGWVPGPVAGDSTPLTDTLGAYSSGELSTGSAKVTLAMRVGDAEAAVVAATRMAAPSSPLTLRLRGLPHPFRVTSVVGAARPKGGCLAVTIETTEHPEAPNITTTAAVATALARQELRSELDAARGVRVATRQVLAAADAREAGSRAAWWALAGAPSSLPERLAVVLALAPAPSAVEPPRLDEARRQFGLDVARALGAPGRTLDKKLLVERGQGELWVLLASPCGAANEGVRDAGSTALSVVAAAALAGSADVAIEPWISASGVGIIAHGARRGAESSSELARRVGDAAARALLGSSITQDALATARALTLAHLETASGQGSAALEAFASAVSPDQPSWLDPFGVWSRVAGSRIEAVRLHRRALADGPLRVAVLANVDEAQAAAAAAAVERWLPPAPTQRACPALAPATARPGRYEIRLARDAADGQAAIGAVIDPRDRPLAELAAALLAGQDGLARKALAAAPIAAQVSARVLGGERATALVVEIRAQKEALGAALDQVKEVLLRVARDGPTEPDFARVLAARVSLERDAERQPRTRLVRLWGQPATSSSSVTLTALRTFLSAALKDGSLIVVEALAP